MARKKLHWTMRRRSGEGQQGNESFRTQRKELENAIMTQGKDPTAKEEDRILYVDTDAVSGEALLGCPEIINMLQEIERLTDYDHMVWSPKSDRYTRHTGNAITIEEKLERLGVPLTFVEGSNPKNRRDYNAKTFRKMGYVMSEWSKDNTAETMRSNKLNKLRRNVWCLGSDKLPDGYSQRAKKDIFDKEDRPVHHDEERREMWQWVYKMIHFDDLSLGKTVKALKEAGYTRRNGKPWTTGPLSGILGTPGLCGIVVCNQYDNDMYMKENKKGEYKKYVKRLAKNPVDEWIIMDFTKPPNDAKPMLTVEQLWEIHLDLQRHKINANGQTPKNTHILKNAVTMKCGLDDCNISKQDGYYACHNRRTSENVLKEEGKEKCLDSTYVRSGDLDEYVTDVTEGILLGNDKAVDSLMDITTHKTKLATLKNDLDRLDIKEADFKHKLNKNYKTFVEGKVSEEMYLEMKAELEKFVEKIQSDRAEKEIAIAKVQESLDSISSLKGDGSRLNAIGRQLLPYKKLRSLSFDERKKLFKILYKDFTFKFMPISLEDAKNSIPPGDDLKWHGYFFNRSNKVGTYVICEGFWQEDEIVRRFEAEFKHNVDSIMVHGHVSTMNV